jgi:hypothetical protein
MSHIYLLSKEEYHLYKGDSYRREVVVLVLTDSSVNIFGDHTRETFIFKTFEDLLQIILKNQKSPWLKVLKRKFNKIVAYFKHVSPF